MSRVRTALRPTARIAISSGEGWYQMLLPPESIVDVIFAIESAHQAEAALAAADSAGAAASAAVVAMIASREVLPELTMEWVVGLRQDMSRTHLRALDVLLQLWPDSGQFRTGHRRCQPDPRDGPTARVGIRRSHDGPPGDGKGWPWIGHLPNLPGMLAAKIGAGPGTEVQAAYEKLLEHSA